MEVKKRNPFVALLLSIIAPGLGQIYNGQVKKGVIFYIIVLLLALTLSIAKLYFYGLIIILGIFLSCFIFTLIDAFITAVKIKKIRLTNYNKWQVYLIFFLISSAIGLIDGTFFVTGKTYSIPSTAMQDTLLVGDYLMANNAAYGLRNSFDNKVWLPIGQPRRGDLAVFIFPEDHSKDYIKRVIGLPGERVQIINKKVYLNGELYQTPQARFVDDKVIPAAQSTRDNYGPVVVPKDSYFVLGDNRDQTYDSRFWGFVPFDLLRGKALYVYFSWDRQDSRVRWERLGISLN
jgi:signal peptidase I